MITEKEEQFRKIQDEYDSFTYMFYESMRDGGNYHKTDVDKQIDKLITRLKVLKEM